jgi:hypothetical protein
MLIRKEEEGVDVYPGRIMQSSAFSPADSCCSSSVARVLALRLQLGAFRIARRVRASSV